MKWVAALVLLMLCPVIAVYLRARLARLKYAAFALGLLPLVTNSWDLYFATISFSGWQGPVRGIELAAVDFLALAILFATYRHGERPRPLWPWIAYAAAVFLTVPLAEHWVAAFAYFWQLLRVILMFAAAYKVSALIGTMNPFLKGLFLGLTFQAVLALLQVAQGDVRAAGSLGGPNTLGLVAHFALYPALAVALGGNRGWWPIIGIVSAATIAILAASRAAAGFAAIGIALTIVLSIAKGASTRKSVAASLAIFAALIAAPIAIDRIQSRADGGTFAGSNQERAAFNRAAWMIIADHPFGTGSNNYVTVANVGGYSARAGVIWNAGSRSAAVHNTYLLTWAEAGIPGLIALVLIFVTFASRLFRHAYSRDRGLVGDLALGAGVATVIVAAHILYEWVFAYFVVQYVFAAMLGSTLGVMSAQTANSSRVVRRNPISWNDRSDIRSSAA